jgi:hypothetical protein
MDPLPEVTDASHFRSISRGAKWSNAVGLSSYAGSSTTSVGCHRIPNEVLYAAFVGARSAGDQEAMRGLLGFAQSVNNMRTQPSAHNDIHSGRERAIRGNNGDMNSALRKVITLQASRFRTSLVGASSTLGDATVYWLFLHMTNNRAQGMVLEKAIRGMRFSKKEYPQASAVVKNLRKDIAKLRKGKRGQSTKAKTKRGQSERGQKNRGDKLKVGSKSLEKTVANSNESKSAYNDETSKSNEEENEELAEIEKMLEIMHEEGIELSEDLENSLSEELENYWDSDDSSD